ncbi:50S ribosomal protein L28 [Candidatus Clavichlamydia salmonicola]|uniref:50S ribosomal protein L28 n=1 Tax=Candidatus Clavichlamydia salmonicola TaxID=469812 RepID=UPI0018913251|nr:50S ribosomal protein L28 [Candidatus Clavichlamydia salmonicola]MBF5050822.1 50S ribosomal protein L28 [Candidatus Clavichlamydia salmonicola]
MSRKCPLTGRVPASGNTYTLRGIAKKKKGIGLKITGKTKRRFFPNLISKKLWVPEENRFIRLRISAAALRTVDKHGFTKVLQKAKDLGYTK